MVEYNDFIKEDVLPALQEFIDDLNYMTDHDVEYRLGDSEGWNPEVGNLITLYAYSHNYLPVRGIIVEILEGDQFLILSTEDFNVRSLNELTPTFYRVKF